MSSSTDEIALNLTEMEVPGPVNQFIQAGLERGKSIDWFDFVASDYGIVYTVLAALERGRMCEWGSGMGVVTGLAEMLGYTAIGVEIHEPLAVASRQYLSQFGLSASIEVGDYFDRADQADLYFTYCWPNRVARTTEHFHAIAPAGARLLIYYGRADIRWIARQR